METKVIGVILLICAALLFQYGYEDLMEEFFSPSVKLQSAIEKDISKTLHSRKAEEKKITDIKYVKFSYRSESAHEFLKNHPPKFQTSKNGTIWLEVEIMDLQDEDNPGFITQTSIFDVKTNNKIDEFGETYFIKDFDKKTKISIQKKTEAKQKSKAK